MMKSQLFVVLTAVAAASLFHNSVSAFQPNPNHFVSSSLSSSYRGSVKKTRTDLFASLSTAVDAKQNLIQVAERLKETQGVLIVDSTAQRDLKQAVAQLEALADPPSRADFDSHFRGDWTLLCSTATNTDGIDLSKLPFLNQGPLKQIRDSINKCLVVKQRIKSADNSTTNTIDRVDHVLEYQPPDSLREILDDLPEALKSLNINPLHITESKVTLIHKAQVESVVPVLRTKLTLESIVLSAAGKNTQFLDPSGSDLFGVNVPLGEFLNSGYFDTTYMDEHIRISRGKLGAVDQLRVFVRSDKFYELQEESDSFTTLDENVGEVIVGGAMDETEEAVDDDMMLPDEDDDEKEEPAEEAGEI